MKRRSFLFLFAIMISSCGKSIPAPSVTEAFPSVPPSTQTAKPTETPLPTVTPACISPKPTQDDVDRALSYTGETLNTPNWEQSYTVNETSVAVLWQDAPQGALVYLEARIKPCGYEEPDLNREFSDENWGATFANYESYELTGECKNNDGLRLYEFKTQNQGFEYGIRYWIKSDTDTRVISLMIVFPLESQDMFDGYSISLFPAYPSCP